MSVQHARGHESRGELNDSQTSVGSGGEVFGGYGPPFEDLPDFNGEHLHRDHKDFTHLHGGRVTHADKPAYMQVPIPPYLFILPYTCARIVLYTCTPNPV